MRVKAKYSDCKHLDESSFAKIGYSPRTVIHITRGTEYDVYAISIFKGQVSLQIINDLSIPIWHPSVFFEICDGELPKDWIINMFQDELEMLLGPKFVVKDLESYSAMALTEPKETRLFWERVEKIKKEHIHNEVLEKLRSVLDNKLSYEEVANWATSFLDDTSKKEVGEETRDLVYILMGFDVKKMGRYIYNKTEIKKLLDTYSN